MRLRFRLCAILGVAFAGLVFHGPFAKAANFDLIDGLLDLGSGTDIHGPRACDQCKGGPDCPQCIERIPVKKCVTGLKKNYKCKVRYEYVTIPEVRYRWKKRLVTKEIPADGCKPVCKKTTAINSYEVEKWEKHDGPCGKIHCKTCLTKQEKIHCAECSSVPGKTTIKVRYWTTIKEPYTVYRQVRREVCVKTPCYEKVHVPVTAYDYRRACADGASQ